MIRYSFVIGFSSGIRFSFIIGFLFVIGFSFGFSTLVHDWNLICNQILILDHL